MKRAGYLSLIALMGSLPDIVRIDRPVENGDWLLYGAGDGMLLHFFHKALFKHSIFHCTSLSICTKSLAKSSADERWVLQHSQHFTKHSTKHSIIILCHWSCDLLVPSVGCNYRYCVCAN